MIIGIDGNEANVSLQVGVSVYTHKLLSFFQMQASSDLRFRIYLRKEPLEHMPKATEFFTYEVVHGTFMWSQFFLPLHLLMNNDFDVFFAPAHYSPRGLKKPLVVTIHDLSYFLYPDNFLQKDLYKLKEWTKISLEKAVKVISVSKTTKKDIIHYYAIPNEKITVIYNGFEKQKIEKETDIVTKLALEKKKYFLYVGTLQPRKNIGTLIDAFMIYNKTHPEYKLVISGKKGWMYEEILAKVPAEYSERILFTDYLPDDDVATLYRSAQAFVQPSLYEGFGIPILEAMSFSCPVIASQTASLPEVGADACLYFDPTNAKELSEKMEQLVTSSELRKELVTKGKKRISTFSWDLCAKETLATITSVVS